MLVSQPILPTDEKQAASQKRFANQTTEFFEEGQ